MTAVWGIMCCVLGVPAEREKEAKKRAEQEKEEEKIATEAAPKSEAEQESPTDNVEEDVPQEETTQSEKSADKSEQKPQGETEQEENSQENGVESADSGRGTEGVSEQAVEEQKTENATSNAEQPKEKSEKSNKAKQDELNAPEGSKKFSLKDKPVRFEAGKKLTADEKKEVLATLKDAYRENGVSYHIEESASGRERRVYEATADDYVKSDITGRLLRYYITLPDGRVAHPTEVYPNVSDRDIRSAAAKQSLLDKEVDDTVKRAVTPISDKRKALDILNQVQSLQHETRDMGYGLYHPVSYGYKTGISCFPQWDTHF